MKNKFKQFIALFLCAVMVLTSGMFSIGANLAATDNAGSEYAEAETEATADTASASSETTETDEPKTTVAAEETAAPEETAEPTAETTAVPEETAAPEETAEATASAEPAATSAPVKTEYDYSDSKVTVTATLSNPSIIPDDAQLVVTQITPDTEGYNYEAYMGALNSTEEEASADSADKYDENNTLLYDIAFIGYENDEAGNSKQVEYQPEAGSVKIDIQFHKNQLSDLGASEADDVEVMHLPLAESVKESTATTKAARNITADDITVKPAEESQADSNLDTVSFSTSSFSIFAVVSEVNWEKDFVTFNKNGTQIYYFNNRLTDEDYNALEKELDVSTKEDVDKNIKLIYHYVDDASETFQNTEYYNANRALGIAGNFHIVAFNTATLNAHTNGNILTSTLNAYSNFGTNSHDKINIDEVSYIAGNYQNVNSISANNGNAANALAVSNETSVGFADNGNAFSINNNKLDAPHILYRDSKTLKFIDLDSVKKEMDSVSSTLATDGGSAKLKGVTEEDNEQNNTFTITDPDGIGYINLKASDISSLKSNVYFKGFKSGHNGSIIVNVDMSDATTENNIKTVTLPERAYIYIDDKQQGTNEVVDFSAGKIIWNFINSDGAKIVAKNMSGSIIAPGADVELTQNINGTIIANNVQNTAETHRSDFTGIIKGDTTSFKVKKEFKEGDEWPDGSSYSFTITADDTNNQYLPTYKTVTLTKDKRTDGFGDIYFPYIAGHDGKTVYYYYTVKEDSSSPVNGVKYDTKQYNIKIGVEYSNNTKTNVKSATIKHILISTDGKSIDDNTKEWKVFNKNTDEFTFTNEVIKDNQKTDARLTVVKKAGDTGSALKGAGFTLYSGETAIGNEYKTNDDGKFTISTSDKALADYLPTTDEAVQLTLKETTVPEGYKAVTDQTVSITRTVTTGWDAEKKVYVTTTAYQINGGQSEMDLTDEKADTSKVAAVIISGTKTVNGLNDLSSVAGLFRFELLNSDNDNKVIDTAKNNAQGKFSFAKITYDTAGDYHYTVREINGGRVINGFRYSNQSYQVTVHVGDEDKDGVLAANISNIQNENNEAVSEIEFRNTALRSLHVAKIWDDNHNTAGMRPKSIQVQLFEDEKLVDGSTATLSAETGWSHDYTGLDKTKSYTVKEVMPDDSGYTPSQAVSADGNTVYLINTFTVNLRAHKTLKGALIQNGEFKFKLVRNSDPANAYYAVNDGSGNIYFNNIPYDEEGYTVTEVSENGDPHITYDADAITYDKDGKIISSKTEFINTERPAVLRVQKTSKEEPHDPLVGAVYGLYMAGADGTNDVLVEAQTSDANGYMYYTKFQEGVWYYFKEISAPAGHEVDPYPGQKFEIKYQADGSLTMVDQDGKVISTADITDSASTEAAAYVQINTAQTDLNSITADAGHVKLTSDSDGVKAVAVAVAGALPADTQLQVKKVNLSETAEENLKKQVGAVKSVAYYDVSFISQGEKVEPEAGTVTVTIQEDNGTAIPSDVNPSNLKLVHLLDDEAKGVAPVYGSIEVDGNTMHGASVTSSSFSIFGVVEPEDMTAFGSNYLLTASGVSDKVSKVQIAKLDTSGKYVIGADLQIIEKKTGKVVAEWNTSEGNKVFNRFFSEDEPLNVDTDYVLHEVSAPEGYQKADDIVFRLNKYDSSLSIWRYDEKGNLVEDTKSADEAVTDFTLTMTDKPIKVEKDKVYKQKTVHKDTVLYKNNEVTETITTTDKKGNKVTVTRYGTNTVNTGVTSHTGLYITLIVIAAAAVVVITVLKNRNKKEAE